MILLLDNYDSFTYNLYDLFFSFGFKVLVLNFIPFEYMFTGFKCVCFGPGTGDPCNYPALSFLFFRIYRFIPVIGICLGHQVISLFFKLPVLVSTFVVHGLLTVANIRNLPVSFGIPCSFYIVRYNSLYVPMFVLFNLLVCVAFGNFNDVMVFEHRILPILGIQFHPDSFMCFYGRKLLRNFFVLNELV